MNIEIDLTTARTTNRYGNYVKFSRLLARVHPPAHLKTENESSGIMIETVASTGSTMNGLYLSTEDALNLRNCLNELLAQRRELTTAEWASEIQKVKQHGK
jgi:hypothetical protein